MKKILVFIFFLLLAFSLFGCSYNRPTSKTKTTDTTDKIISLVTGFNVSDTNGFDYSLKQIYESQVVNFHSVSLRIDNDNNQASRIETIKELNGNINESLYNESTIETYFKNNEIIIKDNDEWIRKEYSYDEYISLNINLFNIRTNIIENLETKEEDEYILLSFKIKDQNSSLFLGIKDKVDNLIFNIKVDKNINKLLYLSMSYSNDITNFIYEVTINYLNEHITLPI